MEKNNPATVDGWVARDADDNSLWFYTAKPKRSTEYMMFYHSESDSIALMEQPIFDNITWENSPVKVKLTITIEDNEEK